MHRTRHSADQSLQARICPSQFAQTASPTANRSEWTLEVHQQARHISDHLHKDLIRQAVQL